MIYPISLYNFGKVCKNSTMAGNVLRKLCKQDVELDENEQMVYEMIANDNGWMDERMQVKREKERVRKAERRAQNRAMDGAAQDAKVQDKVNVPQCPTDKTGQGGTSEVSQGQRGVPHPSYLPTSLPSSLPSSPESESVVAPARSVRIVNSSLDKKTVVGTATGVMGIPQWYAEYWYDLMEKIAWEGRNGANVKDSWRKTLMSYWQRESEQKKAEIKAEAEAQRKAAIVQEPTEADWVLCAERCKNCHEQANGTHSCYWLRKPPTMHNCPPEECKDFAPKEVS